MNKNRFLLFCVFSLLSLMNYIIAKDNKDAKSLGTETYLDGFSYKPVLSGTIRGKFEYLTEESLGRFEVRNARLSVKGWVMPMIDYVAQFDFSDEGVFKTLDAYGRIHFKDYANIMIGQMRMPFSVDATRGPHLLYFATRSFVAKQVGNVRDVGVKLTLMPFDLPLSMEIGAFNGTGFSGQKQWKKDFAYSGKVNYKLGNVKFETGFESVIPDSVRMNIFDTSVSWKYDRWFIEGEYMNKHYAHSMFDNVNAYTVMVNYTLPLPKVFNSVTFGSRFDGMDNHSNGVRDDSGHLIINDVARKRLTCGATLSFEKLFKADLRINYEKYFYDNAAIVKESEQDKIVMELMIHF